MESEEIIYEKVYASPGPPPKISYKDNWMKELDLEHAGGSEDSQQIQPKSKTQLSRTVRPVSEQPPALLTKSKKDVLFGCESTNSGTVRLVAGPPSSQSCVPVSVELVDKDADENVDADQTRTGETCEWTTNRFVHSAREYPSTEYLCRIKSGKKKL